MECFSSPYYLIAVIYGKEDAHIIRAFHFPSETERGILIWMQSGGLKEISFAKNKERIITDFPQNPLDFTTPNCWDRFLGYYLVPTINSLFYTPKGSRSQLILNMPTE